MKQPNSGKKLCLVLALSLVLSSCRTTRPPAIENYIGDGFGGADGVEADGTAGYKSPSQLEGWWMTSQPSMARFSAWCYGISEKTALELMQKAEGDPEKFRALLMGYPK